MNYPVVHPSTQLSGYYDSTSTRRRFDFVALRRRRLVANKRAVDGPDGSYHDVIVYVTVIHADGSTSGTILQIVDVGRIAVSPTSLVHLLEL